MRLLIGITLGNDAMLTGSDVAALLHNLARRLDYREPFEKEDQGALYDINGNRVGGWHVEEE